MAKKIVIKSGDTLSGLAKIHNTNVNDLLRANPNISDPNVIVAGASLNLPTVPALSPAQESPQDISVSSGAPYIIKSGDTLSKLASERGTTIAELMRINPDITNPNLIYEGKSINLPGGGSASGGALTKSGVPDYSGITTIEDANATINADQEADKASFVSEDEPPVRKTTDQIIADIRESVTPETEKPELVSFTESFKEFRTEYGVVDLEDQLNKLKAQEDELFATKRTRIRGEKGKTVASNVIAGRVGEVEAQENERIGVIQRSIANVTNQLNMKYNVINTLMKTTELDYNTAVASYDKEMANNISMFNAARNIEESEKTELERERDNARSNAQIAINAITASGTTYDELSADEQANLTKLGVQSGLGAGFFSTVLKTSAGKDILTTIVSADDTKVTILYKDGTTKTISTGLPAKVTPADKITDDQKITASKTIASNQLKGLAGEDKDVSPEDWAEQRQLWIDNTPYKGSDFDDFFRSFIDPTHPQDYAGFETYKPGFIKKSAIELQAE